MLVCKTLRGGGVFQWYYRKIQLINEWLHREVLYTGGGEQFFDRAQNFSNHGIENCLCAKKKKFFFLRIKKSKKLYITFYVLKIMTMF